MHFQLSDVLKAIGPTASIIFAAWIFLSFLQSRYDAALARYRELLGEHRKGEDAERAGSAKREIEVYARRCTIMSWAVTLGLVSAILFLVTLIGGALDVIFPRTAAITLIASTTGVAGFTLVIVAAGFVIVDNIGAPGQIRQELDGAPGVSRRAVTGLTKLAK